MEQKAFNDRLLRVNLSSNEVEAEQIGLDVLRKYIGGVSLGYYYLLKEIKEKIESFSAENKIVFTTSPEKAGILLPQLLRLPAAAQVLKPADGGGLRLSLLDSMP